METIAQRENVALAERHYAVIEVAEMWNLSPDKVREIFEHEPGVLVIGDRNPRHKRRYLQSSHSTDGPAASPQSSCRQARAPLGSVGMLTIYRRHKKSCKHRAKGRKHRHC